MKVVLAGFMVLLLAPDAARAAVVTISAPTVRMVANGRAMVALDLTITAPDGTPAPDGVVVPLDVSLGRVLGVTPVEDGHATAWLRAGTWPGVARLTSPGNTVLGDDEIWLAHGSTVDMQLHLHGSLSEGTASMADHARDAELTGVDVLWWTDHDGGYLHPDYVFEVLDFDDGDTVAEVEHVYAGPGEVGFALDDATFVDGLWSGEVLAGIGPDGSYGWRLEGIGGEPLLPRDAEWSFSLGKTWASMLLSDIELSFWLYPRSIDRIGPGDLFLTIPFSSNMNGGSFYDDHDTLVFYWSPTDWSVLSDEHTVYVPIDAPADNWTHVTFNLSEIAAERLPRGVDQHMEAPRFRIQASLGHQASFDIDDFRLHGAYLGEELRDRQRDYLDAMPYAVEHLVGTEISAFGQATHLNAYGSSVPFLPYDTEEMLPETAVQFVHDHGGIVSYNHMFGTGSAPDDLFELPLSAEEALADLLDVGVYGVDLLEVGYRQRVFELAEFLTVWDALGAEGYWITGIGSSDLHNVVTYLESENNFVTWVASSSSHEEDLLWELKRGAAWFGDPTVFPGGDVRAQLRAVTSRATMGQVVVGATAPEYVRLDVNPVQAGWYVRWIVDGEPAGPDHAVMSDGHFRANALINPAGGKVVRFEVYEDLDEPPVLLSNPIYFVDAAGWVPPERIPDP